MDLRIQPNRWSCLLTSFSMALDIDESILLEKIGHDGSEILWPEINEPYKRRGFSIHELTRVAYELGFYIHPLVACHFAQSTEDLEAHPYPNKKEYIDEIMNLHIGVLTGSTKGGKRHAVAWNRTFCYDPGGIIYVKEEFRMEAFWAIVPKDSHGCSYSGDQGIRPKLRPS